MLPCASENQAKKVNHLPLRHKQRVRTVDDAQVIPGELNLRENATKCVFLVFHMSGTEPYTWSRGEGDYVGSAVRVGRG